MKKIISVLLCIVLILGTAVQPAVADTDEPELSFEWDGDPVIFIQGYSGPILIRDRGTETEEKILLRLARAKEEIAFADCYDYVVYNYDGRDKEAADKIISIVEAEKALVSRNPDIVKKFLSE